MPLALNDADGKSEATLLVEGLVDAMMLEYEAFKEAMRIPLGAQEVTRDGFRKWFKAADPQLRMQFIQQNGVEQTLAMLGSDITGIRG